MRRWKRPDKSACVAYTRVAHIPQPRREMENGLQHRPQRKGIERAWTFPVMNSSRQIQNALPSKLQDLPFRVDMAPLDPRPTQRIRAAFPARLMTRGQGLSTEPWKSSLICYQTRLVQFRIYALDHDHDAALSTAAATVLNKHPQVSRRTFSVSPSLNQVQQFSQLPSNSPPPRDHPRHFTGAIASTGFYCSSP